MKRKKMGLVLVALLLVLQGFPLAHATENQSEDSDAILTDETAANSESQAENDKEDQDSAGLLPPTPENVMGAEETISREAYSANSGISTYSTISLTTDTVENYVNQLLADASITVSNVSFSGSSLAASSFTSGSGILGIDTGILLSTGETQSSTSSLGTAGDVDLNAMTGKTTYDAVAIEFDFVPKYSTLTFEYVFGSREYPTYVGSSYNDAFAFFVNGVNAALIPGTSDFVSINNVNAGMNSGYFIDNTDDHLGALPGTEFGGITTVMPISVSVLPNEVNHIKLVIADASDSSLDSFVAISSNSFKASGKVNVSYQDEEGNTLADDMIIDGTVGDDYDLEPKEIPGYDFVEWQGDSPSGQIGDEPINIIAIYKKKTVSYQVDFESNGGSAVDSQTVLENELSTKPTDPIKAGFTFEGWYVDEELTTLWDFATPITDNVTLYAKWISEVVKEEPKDENKNKDGDKETPEKKSEGKLPLTGEQLTTLSGISGGILVSTAGLYYYDKQWRKKFKHMRK